jgi:hypothetical protein
MPRRKEHVIVLGDAPEQPTRYNPAVSQVERLLNQSLLETQSLKIVHGLLIRDNVSRAMNGGTQRLLTAAQLRSEQKGHSETEHVNGNGHTARKKRTAVRAVDIIAAVPETGAITTDELVKQTGASRNRVHNITYEGVKKGQLHRVKSGVYSRALDQRPTRKIKDGRWARSKEQRAKQMIAGPRLMLFLLEHMDDQNKVGALYLMDALAKAGTKLNRLNGVLGQMGHKGWIKRSEDGYRRLAAGREWAKKLRAELEADGAVVPGGYLMPPNYTTQGRGTPRAIRTEVTAH